VGVGVGVECFKPRRCHAQSEGKLCVIVIYCACTVYIFNVDNKHSSIPLEILIYY
jgi:hypothetical protein